MNIPPLDGFYRLDDLQTLFENHKVSLPINQLLRYIHQKKLNTYVCINPPTHWELIFNTTEVEAPKYGRFTLPNDYLNFALNFYSNSDNSFSQEDGNIENSGIGLLAERNVYDLQEKRWITLNDEIAEFSLQFKNLYFSGDEINQILGIKSAKPVKERVVRTSNDDTSPSTIINMLSLLNELQHGKPPSKIGTEFLKTFTKNKCKNPLGDKIPDNVQTLTKYLINYPVTPPATASKQMKYTLRYLAIEVNGPFRQGYLTPDINWMDAFYQKLPQHIKEAYSKSQWLEALKD